jgi:hypothetical protein
VRSCEIDIGNPGKSENIIGNLRKSEVFDSIRKNDGNEKKGGDRGEVKVGSFEIS